MSGVGYCGMANKCVTQYQRKRLCRAGATSSVEIRAGKSGAACRIVLLSSQGYSGVEIAERVGCSEPTVICWRNRYAQCGLAGLGDQLRRGRPPSTSPTQLWEILWLTVNRPPVEEGITHWSTRLLAKSRCAPLHRGENLDALWA
jgi:hypothetical protein